MMRSIAVVVLGFLFIGVVAIGLDVLLVKALPGYFVNNHTDNVAILLLITCYVGVVATLGCYLCARFAPSHPMRHALILGVLGLAFNIMGTVKSWGHEPAWYLILSLLLVMPYAWLGGAIRERQLRAAQSPTSLQPA